MKLKKIFFYIRWYGKHHQRSLKSPRRVTLDEEKGTSPKGRGESLAVVLGYCCFSLCLCRSWSLLSQQGFPGSSASKELACNAGDPGSIPGSGRSPGEGNGYPLQFTWASPGDSHGKESACNAGDLGSIPGVGRSQMLRSPWRAPLFGGDSEKLLRKGCLVI